MINQRRLMESWRSGISTLQVDETTRNTSRDNKQRLGHILRIFPVVFVVLTGILVYFVFVVVHLFRLFQLDHSYDEGISLIWRRGMIESIIVHFLLVMVVTTYSLSVFTSPGSIPEDWNSVQQEDHFENYSTFKHRNALVRRRFCKWCMKYKPDRAHHCRQCRRCVLKMDHHCPWIYNCVGYGNHKYFILLLIYSSLATLFIFGAQMDSIRDALDNPQIFFRRFSLLFFNQLLAGLVAIISIGLLGFHLWLVVQNISTIEFCEKRYKKSRPANIYNRGCLENLKDVLGRNLLLWLVPIQNQIDDGLQFPVASDCRSLLTI